MHEKTLGKKLLRDEYVSACGALQPSNRILLDFGFVSYVASLRVLKQVAQVLPPLSSFNNKSYPSLAALQHWFEPIAQQLPMPFGLLQAMEKQGTVFGADACLSWRFVALIELPHVKFQSFPFSLRMILEMIKQQRQQMVAAGDVVASDLRTILLEFYDDDWSCGAKAKWLCKALRLKSKKEDKDEKVNELLDQAVNEFFTDLEAWPAADVALGTAGLAACALCGQIGRAHV